jgi:hypothetical protein
MAMAVEPLTAELRDAGFSMRTQLDAIGLRPQGLMWLHFAHLRDWRFTVISDLLSEIGRTRLYGLLGEALDKIDVTDGLTIFDVHLAAPDEIVTAAIENVFDIELGDAPAAVELIDCRAHGERVDAFVYRMSKPRSKAEVRRAAREFTATAKAFTGAF